MVIYLRTRLLEPFSDLPGGHWRPGPSRARTPSPLRRRAALFPLLDLAPGGVCRARPVTRPAGELLPHRFTLTCRTSRRGGLLSVALSLASRPVGVTHRPALRSPDFPPAGVRGQRISLRWTSGRRPSGPLQASPTIIGLAIGRINGADANDCLAWCLCVEIPGRRIA